MRILSNFLALIICILVIGALFFFLFPVIENELPLKYHKEETAPMPTNLHPTVEEKKEKLVSAVKDKGIRMVITEGHRTEERQEELYQQGRSKEGRVVTHARPGESYHNYGLAIDFALQTPGGNLIWDMEYDGNDNGKADWMEVVDTAKGMGFHWGGDWKNFQDYPHLQMDFGLTIRELKYGKRPKVTDYADD
ncbi:M15 family metallopeptidase [Halobacillus litoralis]|uniref:M15 family metallopeptidase n=1 Tax=Halobacillus litoralis TaxID=45668 RepID=UPI00299E4C2B|nr:M15 family metallopeptidase [Halobacillus litoralis]